MKITGSYYTFGLLIKNKNEMLYIHVFLNTKMCKNVPVWELHS